MATPVIPAAPAAQAPAAVSAPAPVAAPAPVTPAPVPPATPAAPVTPAAPSKFDPKTSTVAPKSSDYPNTEEGLVEFATQNSEWAAQHPDEANQIRMDRLAAEDSDAAVTSPEAAVAAEVKAAEDTPVDAPKPAGEAVAAATPASIEEWTAKSPELKAAFEKSPEVRDAIMGMARENEAAKPVLEIVGSKEEAQFAVDHANRLVSLQTNWMLAGEDPEMLEPAWEQTVEMFKERDANGAEVKGPDGKPKLGADFKPFQRKAATSALDDATGTFTSTITALEARLKGNYATDAAREIDESALENAKYAKAAFDFVREQLNAAEPGSGLPALPANATPEQIEFQKKLEQQQAEINAKSGKQTGEARKAARVALDREVQNAYESGLSTYIDTQVEAMKARNEYLPDFVLNDKWINPATQKVTNLSAFGVKLYQEMNKKILGNPVHAAKLASLQALGAAGKDARLAEVARLQGLYLPNIFNAEVKRIQDGIRGTNKPKPAGVVDPATNNAGKPRQEPNSVATVVPSGMGKQEIRTWAEGEAKKDPTYTSLSDVDKEALIMTLAAKKRYGG